MEDNLGIPLKVIMEDLEQYARKDVCVIAPNTYLRICNLAQKIFKNESSLIEIDGPVYIFGDLHGQFSDLLRLVDEIGSRPPKSVFLFLGDYVDRGTMALEVVAYIFLLKIMYPKHVYMLRGNHEHIDVNTHWGFYNECKERSTKKVFQGVNETFDYLPLAAVVSRQAFCVHGGLSRELNTLDQLRDITKPVTVIDGLVKDLLWADPSSKSMGWSNMCHTRGALKYGPDVTSKFLDDNSLLLIFRAHEVVDAGVRIMNDTVTVFSAPEYDNRHQNLGAAVYYKDGICFDVVDILGERARADSQQSTGKKRRQTKEPTGSSVLEQQQQQEADSQQKNRKRPRLYKQPKEPPDNSVLKQPQQ